MKNLEVKKITTEIAKEKIILIQNKSEEIPNEKFIQQMSHNILKSLNNKNEESIQKLKQQKASKKKRGTGFLDILNIGLEYNDKIQNQLSNPNITKEEQQKQQKNAEEISAMANQEIRKLHEKISELKFQNETYFKKMNQSLEDAENKRMEHKNEVKNYTDKINKLENEIQKLQKEKGELNNRINTVLSMSSQNMKETEHFKVLLNDYKKDREMQCVID